MGRHASAVRRRRVAAWPVVLGVVILLVTAAVVVYFQIVNSKKDAAACTGTTVLPVVASPGAARAVRDAASAFDATTPVARSTCVSISVTTVAGPTAVTALVGGWRHQSSPGPALWVADSLTDVATLDAADSAMTAGHSAQPLATSPVVLAMRASAPGSPVSWRSLAAGTADGVTLAIPDPTANRASVQALSSLIAAGSDTGVLDPDSVDAAAGLFGRLAAAVPSPATTQLALADLSAGTSQYTAVPVVESDLATFNASAAHPLVAVYPAGPTGGDALLPVPLTAGWVTATMSDAAAGFSAFLGNATGRAVMDKDRLRVVGTSASASGVGGIDLAAAVSPLSEPSGPVRAAILAQWSVQSAPVTVPTTAPPTSPPTPSGPVTSTPPGGGGLTVGTTQPSIIGTAVATATIASSSLATPRKAARSTPPVATVTTTAPPAAASLAVTVVLDVSGSMDTVVDGRQRLDWVRSAVRSAVQANPGDAFGLWSYSTRYTQLVPLGPLSQPVNGLSRASAITAALNGLTAAGTSYTYGAIQTVLSNAADLAVQGRPSRVVLVTDGPDSTPRVARDTVKAAVAQRVHNTNVTLDIIGLSGDVNPDALTQIAHSGGGTFIPLPSLTALTPTLTQLAGS